MQYDFSVLNDKEFERLSMDILNEKFSLDLQSFKNGKDGGIDLRYSTSENIDSIVVQAKHFVTSGYRALIRDLKKEVPKVKFIAPDRYIIVTSLPLSAKNKDDIFKLFVPYLKSPKDVFGKEDLNKYLSNLPEIEKKWYKLWLSSTAVLKSVLHNAVEGRSAFAEAKIRKLIRLYVHSKSYDDAYEILRKYKYILITGQPGVGKTTLAHLLTYHLLSLKYKLIYIDSDIRDAEDVIGKAPKDKQVFYFDDFLGANYLEITNPKTSEAKFVTFLDRIKSAPNKFLILTTRTTVFRNAMDKFEKLRRVKVDIARKEIELGQYSDLDKAKILYNHIFHSDLPDEKKNEIFKDKGYWKIIRHTNYNPRLIEFITDSSNSNDVVAGEFMQFVLKNLDNPAQIWSHAYEEQLTVEERLLLHSVFSQKSTSNESHTNRIFEGFLKFEIEHYNFRPASNPFSNAFRNLLDGILRRVILMDSSVTRISFINPSIKDFLTSYFYQNSEERWKLIRGSIFIEQFEQYAEYFFDYFRTKLVNISEESSKLVNHVIEHSSSIESLYLGVEGKKNGELLLRIAAFLNSLRSIDASTEAKVDEFSFRIISSFSLDELKARNKGHFISTIKYAEDGLVKTYVVSKWRQIIIALFGMCTDEEDFDEIFGLFEEYNIDYTSFVRTPSNYTYIRNAVSEYVDERTADWFSDEKTSICSLSDWWSAKVDFKRKRKEIFNKFEIYDDFFEADDFFASENIDEIIEENVADDLSSASNEISNTQPTKQEETESEEEEIEKLFAGEYDPETFEHPDDVNGPGF